MKLFWWKKEKKRKPLSENQFQWIIANKKYNDALEEFAKAEMRMASARQEYAKAHRVTFGFEEPEKEQEFSLAK